MAATKVTINEAGLEQLLVSSDVQSDVTRRAEQVLDKARAEARVLTGEYRDNLHVESVSGEGGVEVLRITSGTDHDIYVEAATGNLARALDAARES